MFLYSLAEFRDLQTIEEDLRQIANQWRVLRIVFKDANKDLVDACVGRLADSNYDWNVRMHPFTFGILF